MLRKVLITYSLFILIFVSGNITAETNTYIKYHDKDQIVEEFFNRLINGEGFEDLLDDNLQKYYPSSCYPKENFIMHRGLNRDDITWVDEWTQAKPYPGHKFEYVRHYTISSYKGSVGTVRLVSQDNQIYYLLSGSGLGDPHQTQRERYVLKRGAPPKYRILDNRFTIYVFVEGNKPFIVKQDEHPCIPVSDKPACWRKLTTNIKNIITNPETQEIFECPLKDRTCYALTIADSTGEIKIPVDITGPVEF